MTLPAFQLADTAELMEHVLPHPLIKIGNFVVTNHLFMVVLVAVLMCLLFIYFGSVSKKRLVPTGMHNLFESILSFFRTEVFRPALGENADRFTPFLWSVFFFVLFCNVLGMVPVNEIASLLTGGQKHLWGTATANIITTAALAITAFVVVHLSGIIQAVRVKMDPSLAPHHTGHDHSLIQARGQPHGIEDERDVKVVDREIKDGHDHAHGIHHSKEFGGQPWPVAVCTGIGSYIWNFAPHPEMGMKAMDIFMWFALLILELMGALVKPLSLCVRLFANMLAGHLVLAALIAMIPFGVGVAVAAKLGVSVAVVAGCTALSVLELFVAFLQAYIFTFLTTLYIASAVAPEH